MPIHKQEKRDNMVLNWLFRRILIGPLIRLFFKIGVEGMENLPKRGPFILAVGPHRTEFESLILATFLGRYWLRFFAKQQYWDEHKLLGRVMTGIGLIPLPRGLGRAMLVQIDEGVKVLKKGQILVMYIEATRGYDDSMHRGYPGFAYCSLRAGGVPVVPVGLIGMRKLNPPKQGLHPGSGTIVIGEPIYPKALQSPEDHNLVEKALERVLIKPFVTRVSKEIARLTESHYEDKELPIPES